MKAIWILIVILLYFVGAFSTIAFLTGCGAIEGQEFTASTGTLESFGDSGTDGGVGVAIDPAVDATPAAPDAGGNAPDAVAHDGGAVTAEAAPESSDDGGCDIVHSAGMGVTYTDCVPRGTYNALQADKACQATYKAQGANGDTLSCLAGLHENDNGLLFECLMRSSGGAFLDCTCWGYGVGMTIDGAAPDPSEIGHVHFGLDPVYGNCEAPSSTDPTWN